MISVHIYPNKETIRNEDWCNKKVFKDDAGVDVALLCYACTKSGHDYDYIVEKNNHEFPVVENKKTSLVELDYPFQIEECMVHDGRLYCKTEMSKRFFYSVSLDNYQVQDSFGIKGHGRGEFVAPHLYEMNDGGMGIYDNGKRKNYMYLDGEIRDADSWSMDLAVNELKTIRYPLLACVLCEPNSMRLQIFNAENGEMCDQIKYEDERCQGKSIQYDFAWDSNDSCIVLAHRYADMIKICRINGDGNFIEIRALGDDGDFSESEVYNTSVACGEYVYVLNQSSVDLSAHEGCSVVEVYDYAGKPVRKIRLDIVADRIVLDEKHDKLLLLSPMDSYWHTVSL